MVFSIICCILSYFFWNIKVSSINISVLSCTYDSGFFRFDIYFYEFCKYVWIVSYQKCVFCIWRVVYFGENLVIYIQFNFNLFV